MQPETENVTGIGTIPEREQAAESQNPVFVSTPANVNIGGFLSKKDTAIQSVSAAISPTNTLAATTLKRLSNSKTIYDTIVDANANSNTNTTTLFPLDISKNFQYYAPIRLLSSDNKISTKSKDSLIVKKSPSHSSPTYSNLECVDIEFALGKSYIDSSNNNTSSNALDVLALYIKGQKLLYTEAKTYCEQQLNFLMLPAIFISCVGSIFSFLSSDYSFGPIIIASLNGFNAFLLALISYLKLDAKAQAHKTSAYKFDKLESVCEFNSGKFMFFAADPEDIFSVVERIEKDVKDIKEMNQFILPESIRYEFHFTYSTNVFMLVKRMQLLELSETHNLKNCVNHLTVLKMQLDSALKTDNHEIIQTLIESINSEEIRKTLFLENVLNCRKKYYELDENFNKEIRDHMKRVNQWFITRVLCCDWLKS